MKRIFALLVSIAIILTAAGCSSYGKTDLMQGIPSNAVDVLPDAESGRTATADFCVKLFQNSLLSEKNTLLSPVSVLYALAMTANGADGETLTQMESVFGMTTEELNCYLLWYMDELPQGDKYSLIPANSIWFTENSRFTPNQDFLKINADYYRADIYSAPFDGSTVREINNWIKDKTEGMIPSIIDSISADAVMYLANTIAFEAEWQSTYNTDQVHTSRFTCGNGIEQSADFMYCQLDSYLEDELATGFVKYYADSSYAFAAILPNEGVTVEDYVSTLTGEHILALLDNPGKCTVYTSIPQFETEYSAEMSDALKSMGIIDAFNANNADFTGLGTSEAGNIYISRVLHRTFIKVGPQGTKAGAAAVVEMTDGCAIEMEEPKTVYLDRPFVYMIIDCQNNIPIFIGTAMSIAN